MSGAAHTLLTLALIWAAMMPSPGPNILFFAATVMSSPRPAVVAAGIGILIGTCAWGLAGLFGLFWLFEAFPVVGLAVKVMGGAYLVYLGFRILRANWRHKPAGQGRPAAPRARPLSMRRAFILGLLTNLSNPKSLIFVTSLFAVTHIAEQPLPVGLAGVAIMVAISGLFYLLLGAVLAFMPRSGESRAGRILSLAIGVLMMAFGARLGFGG